MVLERCTNAVASPFGVTGAFGGTDRYVYAKNVAPWEAQTGVFTLRI